MLSSPLTWMTFWACTEHGHAVVERLLTRFEVGRTEEGRLRFCGKQFDVSGHNVLLDVEDNTRKTTYSEIAKTVTKGEEKQLRSAVGSIVRWIARQVRPDLVILGITPTIQYQGSYRFDPSGSE